METSLSHEMLEPITELPGVTTQMTVSFIPSVVTNSARNEYVRSLAEGCTYLLRQGETVAATARYDI